MKLSSTLTKCFENAMTINADWIPTLLIAFPIKVAPKKIPNGI